MRELPIHHDFATPIVDATSINFIELPTKSYIDELPIKQ